MSNAVVEYNAMHRLAIHVKPSDHRRFKVLCVDSKCSFVVTFAYGRGFEPPHTFAPHSCDATLVDLASYDASRATKASYLKWVESVRQFAIEKRREASAAGLQKKLVPERRRVTYQACVDACARLKEDLLKDDRVQYQFVLLWHGHEEHEYGGALLVACLKNSNNEIQTVAIAWVSGETKDNWSWFLNFLLCSSEVPAFVILDRDKGLIPATQVETGSIPQFLAKSLSISSSERRANEMKEKSAKALEWLFDADKFKSAAVYSLCTRYGTMTSNNVESVNNALLVAREKPLLDCLMAVEKYVGTKWVEFVTKGASCGHLTAYATKEFERKRFVSVTDKIEIIPSCLSLFVARVCKDGSCQSKMRSISMILKSRVRAATSTNMKAPCAHLIAAFRSVNKLLQLKNFYNASWTTGVYKRVYDANVKISPCVTTDNLMRFENHQSPPAPKKEHGCLRKSKRIESQAATEALKAKRNKNCTAWGTFGHNKRTCKG